MRSLGRKKNALKSLKRNLASSLVLYEKIETTLPKAKEVKPFIENIFSIASAGDLNARRKVLQILANRLATTKIFNEFALKTDLKHSGLVRIYRLDLRKGDGAQSARLILSPALRTIPITKDVATKPDKKSTEVKKEEPKVKKNAKITK